MEERALHPEMFNKLDVEGIRRLMEEAQERRLQPGFIKGFFIPAFERLGGKLKRRETDRYEISRVPDRIRELAIARDRRAPVVENYERVTFKRELRKVADKPLATLLAPGHPLLDAVIDLTIEDLGGALSRGTIFIDRTDKQRDEPSALFAVEQKIVNSLVPPLTVDRHFDFIEVDSNGRGFISNTAPYLDFEEPSEEELKAASGLIEKMVSGSQNEAVVRRWAVELGMDTALKQKRKMTEELVEKARIQVTERLNKEINHWDTEHNRLLYEEDKGKTGSISASSAYERARALETRRNNRLQELNREEAIIALPPIVRGAAVVIPSGLIEQTLSSPAAGLFAQSRKEIERRAVDLVLRHEKELGRVPEEMAHNNRGFDIKSRHLMGGYIYIEVKGRIQGADTFTITSSEVSFAQTQGVAHRLALVSVSSEGAEQDEVRYISNAFEHVQLSQSTASINERWSDYWSKGQVPQ